MTPTNLPPDAKILVTRAELLDLVRAGVDEFRRTQARGIPADDPRGHRWVAGFQSVAHEVSGLGDMSVPLSPARQRQLVALTRRMAKLLALGHDLLRESNTSQAQRDNAA